MDQENPTPTIESAAKNSIQWSKAIVISIIAVVAVAAIAGLTLLKPSPGKPTQAIVTIDEKGFMPGTIKVGPGSTVTWKNNGSRQHGVGADPYPTHTTLKELTSDMLEPGESYSFTFTKAGTYTYHDPADPLNILGTVVVK